MYTSGTPCLRRRASPRRYTARIWDHVRSLFPVLPRVTRRVLFVGRCRREVGAQRTSSGGMEGLTLSYSVRQWQTPFKPSEFASGR